MPDTPPALVQKRPFGNTGEQISLLGFGGLRLPVKGGGREIDRIVLGEMVDYAISHGVNYFDTAYGYHGGMSETCIGEALARHPRETFNLATKMPLVSVKSSADVERIFNEQLKKCGVEFFDFYLLHNINKTDWPVIEQCRVYEFLRDRQEQGCIRRLGFSFHDTPALLEETVRRYEWDFAQIQLNYMDWEMQDAKGQYEVLKARGLPVIVMEPVRGGMLAALCDKSARVLKEANAGASIASWALRFAASLPGVVTVLSGMSNMEQLRDNIQTMTRFAPLTPDEYAVIDKALALYRKNTVIPCTACRYCCADCPRGIDIPSVLSIYNNYLLDSAGGRHKNNEFIFRYNVLRSDKQAHNCVKCRKCERKCPQHIAIPDWMGKIALVHRKISRVPFARRAASKLKRAVVKTIKRLTGGNAHVH
jgi:predicted aldo/keto reductase-like oxidoreductase